MSKISIVLTDLRGGGAERLAIHLAKDWLQRGYRVESLLMQKRGELLSLLSPEIPIVDLGVDRIRKVIVPLSKHLKQTRPDVIWAGIWQLTSASVIAWLLAGRPGSLFLTDHNQLSVSVVRGLGISMSYAKA